MLRNFNQNILGLDGAEIKDEKGEPLTLRQCAVNSLLAQDPSDTTVTGVEKGKRFTLAMKIYNAKDEAVDVTAEEVSKVKELIGKVYTALVVGRAYDLLEQKIEEVKTAG